MHGYSYHVTLFVRAHIVRSFCVKHCADCYLIKPQMQNMDVSVNESVLDEGEVNRQTLLLSSKLV